MIRYCRQVQVVCGKTSLEEADGGGEADPGTEVTVGRHREGTCLRCGVWCGMTVLSGKTF